MGNIRNLPDDLAGPNPPKDLIAFMKNFHLGTTAKSMWDKNLQQKFIKKLFPFFLKKLSKKEDFFKLYNQFFKLNMIKKQFNKLPNNKLKKLVN